jgi:hypothetical protein
MNSEIKVARYELYPADVPTCYCVGFAITANGRSSYIDTQVPLGSTTNKTDEDIVALAYQQVGTNIQNWITATNAKPSVLGTVFTPPGA